MALTEPFPDSRRMRAAFSARSVVRGVWSVLADPVAAEIIGACAADYVCVDLQHGHASETTLPQLLQAHLVVGRRPLARVAWNRDELIFRALDSGASGVVVPMVDDARAAARAARSVRFPPRGVRSWGPLWSASRRVPSPGEQDETALCVVMVETRAGLRNAGEIARTDGVDAVYIGPNDLALACGFGRATYRDDPVFDQLLVDLVDEVHLSGCPVGLHCSDLEMAEHWAARGVDMVTAATDADLIAAALAAAF